VGERSREVKFWAVSGRPPTSASWRIIVGMAHHRRVIAASSSGQSPAVIGDLLPGDSEAGPARTNRARLAGPGDCPYSGRLSMASPRPIYPHRHLLGIEGLSSCDINALLDLADEAVEVSRQIEKKKATLRGRTQINLFFEPSTRTQSSFEIAGKRLGADVMNMSVASSSVKKGETLIDTAATLNAMRPDILVVRHQAAGAVHLLARKVECSVVNAGDGAHEHPTQALLDALTIRRRKGRIEGLAVAICGDILHSRVARSNIILLQALGARVRVIAPSTLLPTGIERFGVEAYTDMRQGLAGADIVMMLRLQRERMNGSFVPSVKEYFRYFGLDQEKLSLAKADALVMHPGPMNRGVEISSEVADGAQSLIQEQVEMGVAVRMAVLEALASHLPNG
jgi:aspartate carbamoyltransferase catalytic subunit